MSISCATCGLSFPSHWFSQSTKCIFCTNYIPMRESRMQMIADARNRYLWSGWTDEAAFYKLHVTHLRTWCEHWYIPETAEEVAATEKLLKHQNWTREYWH